MLICVLVHRPLNSDLYMQQRGFLNRDISTMRNWKTAVDVLNSIAGLMIIKQNQIGLY
jgi:hypothetical protein